MDKKKIRTKHCGKWLKYKKTETSGKAAFSRKNFNNYNYSGQEKQELITVSLESVWKM